MEGLATIEEFVRALNGATTLDELAAALAFATNRMGFRYFALTHHVDPPRARKPALRIHNYPQSWVDYFDANALGGRDPVHRASHLLGAGFSWSQLPEIIPLTRSDREVLKLARRAGIGDGYTVPANIPGEMHGSCSFATDSRTPLKATMLPLAQLTGIFAFECARQLTGWRRPQQRPQPKLTERQRQCVIWAAQGKSDWEIGVILNLSRETVRQHIKDACDRYGVSKRTLLVIRALFDGTISFSDIFWR